MELEKYIIILTFIPWLLTIIISLLDKLNNPDLKKFSTKYFTKNIFKIFRLDTLLLIIIFYYFASFDKEFVAKYLFTIMCLYLFVNFFYEKRNYINTSFFKNNIIEIFLMLIVISIPFIYYYNSNNLNITYKIMLLYIFFQYILILIINYLSKLIRKAKNFKEI